MPIYHPPNNSKSKRTLKRFYPHYIDDEYPHFAAMMEAYFEWLDSPGNAYDVSKNIPKYSQIRTTIDDFIEYFREHYLHYIPTNVLADKSLLVRYIKQFYLAKGTEKAYKFLFRILYDEDIELYYPKLDVLRASDGKWVEEKSIKVTSTTPDPSVFDSKIIRGNTTGASALVERVLLSTQQNVQVIELFLSNIRGSFVYGETVSCYDENDEVIAQETIYGVYQSVTITSSGTGYRLNDPFYIRDGFGNKIGSGLITSVQTGGIDNLIIASPGIGYKGLYKLIETFAALQMDFVYNGSPLSEQAISLYASQVIGQSIGSNGILIQQTPDAIVISDADPNSSGGGAAGQIVLVGDLGEILEVRLTNRGSMYVEPVAEIETNTGTGGVITPITTGGQIQTIQLYEFPIEVLNPIVDFTRRGNGNAVGTPNIGTLISYPGRWINTDGHLSSDKRLQDNYYWQDFSYVIKGDVLINQYRRIVKESIHPAGLIVFGELQAELSTDDETVIIPSFEYDHEIESATAVDVSVELETAYGNLDWTPMLEMSLADVWDARSLSAGAVASWPGEGDPHTTLAQGTGANQPTANGTDSVTFDGSNDSLSRGRHKAVLTGSYALPDASGGDPGEGFTCTGLCRAPDGTWWASNDGRNVNGDTSYLPSLVHISADWSVKLGEILLAPLYPGIESVQGVAYDTTDDTLWFCDLAGDKVRHIGLDGTAMTADDISFSDPNGLAYDPGRDMFIVGTTAGVSRVTRAGSVDSSYNAGASTWDHLWYDQALDLVYVSWGTNGIDGGLVVVNLDEDRIVAEYDLPGSDAAEGIYLDGNTLYLLNDGYFHGSPSGINNVLVYDIQPCASKIVDIFGVFSIASTTTTDAVLVAGNPIAGPGWGLFVPSNDQLRVFANTATGTGERVQADCVVATLTALQLVYVRIDTETKTVRIWRNGVERTVTGTLTALDGILTGMTALYMGNAPDTGTRQPAMTVQTLGYYMGEGDRLRTQAWMAHQFNLTNLLPSDDPYKYVTPESEDI